MQNSKAKEIKALNDFIIFKLNLYTLFDVFLYNGYTVKTCFYE